MKYDEGKLWAAVITRALQDAAGRNLKLKKEACKWIRSRSFETVCELANLDSKRLKNMLIKKEGNFMGFSSQKEIKSLLIDNIKECVSYLLPGGEFYQDRFYLANLGKDKIIVEIKGEKAGNWNDIYKEKKGDILSLWTLVEGNIDSAKKWLNAKKNSTLQNNGEKAFSVRHYLNDKSPMPKDIIGPRILTPGGLLVIGGTPKIGKSNFLLSMLVHLAAGVSFLGMKPAKPLKIFYLQNEMEYDYIRERLQKLRISKKTLDAGTENLVITQKIKLTLNVEEIKEIMYENLDVKTVDVIVIDSLFDYRSMISFLKNDVDKLRSITNPMAGVIFTHYTKKVSTTTLKKNPFQALSGANVLRSLYTSGVVIFKPSQHRNVLQVMYELKNGKPIPTKFISEVNGHWKTA
ncbi:putative phage protein [Wolbachia endosymbiont of Armadillidium vulgare str. wVulC]|uniref:AAA family ATPase n=1 Tax=Wolbachia endosymbiont of Armadillidium vulgare TaxID=77039 RepID=UPI00064A1DA3|nr:AAA family ATPase [Wolbachia endosymbiont of Armadillidium vulgare]KLT22686.1 putative phage protein [Wolbachia endosymbiont of Armadillidium vulgare str. wVulC]OJH31405.1 DNA repair protein RadA [Wolbachia endosymbiont of Armadillidium vulgare]